MNKQALTKALEGEHCNECGRLYGDTVYSVPDSVWAVIHERAPAGLLCPTCALDRLARLVERLLPCGTCRDGFVEPDISGDDPHGAFASAPCPDCFGRVWDEGIVEAVAAAILGRPLTEAKPAVQEMQRQAARAVLSAIAQLAEAGSQ